MKSSADRITLFEAVPIPRAVTTLVIPTVLSSLVTMLYNLADTYFVGLLNIPVQNAAVALAAPVLLAFNAVSNLFGVGTANLISRSLGSKDYDTARRASVLGFYCALLCSALFSLGCTLWRQPLMTLLGADSSTRGLTAQYLYWTVTWGAVPSILHVAMAFLFRSEGGSLQSGIGIMSGCILNMVLDPIFILPWGLNLGAAGAGLATFLSNCFSMILFLLMLFCRRGRTWLSLDPRLLRFDRRILKGIFTIGIPASIQNLLNVTGMTLLTNATARFGPTAVAAMGICLRIHTVPIQISMGIAQGMQALAAYNYSSGSHDRFRGSILFSGKLIGGFLLFGALPLLLFPGFFVGLFIRDREIIAIGTVLLRGLMLGVPFVALDFLTVHVIQAVGQGRTALLFAVCRKILFEIPAIVILNRLWPLYGLGCSQLAAELLMAVLSLAYLRRLFRSLQ